MAGEISKNNGFTVKFIKCRTSTAGTHTEYHTHKHTHQFPLFSPLSPSTSPFTHTGKRPIMYLLHGHEEDAWKLPLHDLHCCWANRRSLCPSAPSGTSTRCTNTHAQVGEEEGGGVRGRGSGGKAGEDVGRQTGLRVI